ncbi:molybdopterin cofactor-binding domain-containing protein [Yinghuangia aomiensis]
MVADRADALTGGGHRHAARLKYTHRADSNGRLLAVEAEILLDGGAYATTSPEVVGRLAGCATGPCLVLHAHAVDVWAVRTSNPPAGTMRGPGAAQVCFACEARTRTSSPPRSAWTRSSLHGCADALSTGTVAGHRPGSWTSPASGGGSCCVRWRNTRRRKANRRPGCAAAPASRWAWCRCWASRAPTSRLPRRCASAHGVVER